MKILFITMDLKHMVVFMMLIVYLTNDCTYALEYQEVLRNCIRGIAKYFRIIIDKNEDNYTKDNLVYLKKEHCAKNVIKFLKRSDDGDRFDFWGEYETLKNPQLLTYEDGYFEALGQALDSSEIQKPSIFCVDKRCVRKCMKQLKKFGETSESALRHAYFDIEALNNRFRKIDNNLLVSDDLTNFLISSYYGLKYMSHIYDNFKVKDEFSEPFDYCAEIASQSGLRLLNESI